MVSKIDFRVAEIPNADTFQLHIYSALAEQERQMISVRTKQALAVKKAQGVKLGCPLNEGRIEEAKAFAISLRSKIEDLKANGIVSINAIAKELNRLDVPTRKGGKWYASTVSNYLAKLSVVN